MLFHECQMVTALPAGGGDIGCGGGSSMGVDCGDPVTPGIAGMGVTLPPVPVGTLVTEITGACVGVFDIDWVWDGLEVGVPGPG